MPTPLDRAEYISVETFKKDGTGVKTPVWSAPLDGKLVFATDAGSFKVKRLRNNPKVRVAECNGNGKSILGPWHEGTVRFLDGDAARRADEALAKKYTWKRKAYYFVMKLARRIGEQATIEITLAG